MKCEGHGQYHDVDPAPAVCPKCAKTLDACTNLKGGAARGPREGDFSICFYCSTVLIYQDERLLREAEPEEISPELAQMAEKLTKFRAERQRRPLFILTGRIA